MAETGSPRAVDALAAAALRVRDLASGWTPPDFAHVPDPDAALFLCAVDHRTGYRDRHRVGGEGPLAGSELMWAVALSRAAREPALLSAARLRAVEAPEVAELFRVEGETVADPARRAALWRELAAGVERQYGGSASRLLAACAAHLGGADGLLARLSRFQAYSDPLEKKSQLFAKICARRGWLEVADPECWQVSPDNVLMRLALRAGLVEPGGREHVRASTREAFGRLAEAAGIEPPVLDDLLWELGRDDPDLLGVVRDVREPERDPESAWY